MRLVHFIDKKPLVDALHLYFINNIGMQVNIGIINANPSTTAGAIEIMMALSQYVPKVQERLVVLPVHGDCGAVERMIDAQRARSADLTAIDRLQGLEPVPQEFHHRALMIQVEKALLGVISVRQ